MVRVDKRGLVIKMSLASTKMLREKVSCLPLENMGLAGRNAVPKLGFSLV